MLSSLKRFSKDEVAGERLKILEFYRQYGEKVTKEAFGVDRKLLYVWRKKLHFSQGQLSSLVPLSTKPRRVRASQVDIRIVNFISTLRENHPRLGKEKIKPLVDDYCLKRNLPSISESTVGRIIKRNHLFFQRQTRIYHQPSEARLKTKRQKRLRMRYSPQPTGFGHLQMDTLLKVVDGVRLYVYSVIDIKGKFALSLPYLHLNSSNTKDFFIKLQGVYPGRIKSVQTDNGLEFLGVFEQYLQQRNILHYFIYPRCPRVNGVIERYQRTLQEEFLDSNLDLIHHPKEFSSKLADYLIFFLTERVHKSLGNLTPVDYLIKQGGMSKKSWTYTRA
ncbi:MAG: integrase core domain-containing protein [Patescibacteria group bacterium]